MTTVLPAWLEPRTWVCHLPTKTVFQAMRCQRDKATGSIYLLDNTGRKDYVLTECDRLQLDHFNGIALLITEGQPLSAYRCPGGLVVTDGRRAKRVVLEHDEALKAAQSLAAAFNGVVIAGEVPDADG